MRLLLFLLLFRYSFAQFEYEQYLNLATENNWPKDEANYKAFVEYCNNASSPQTTEPEDTVFTRADCLLISTTQQTTLRPTMKSVREPIDYKNNVFNFVTTANEVNDCTKTTFVPSTTTPQATTEMTTIPPTTEMTTMPTTTEVNLQVITITDGNDRYILDETNSDCDDCLSQTSPSASSSLSTTSVTRITSTQTSISEEATTSVPTLSTESSMTSGNTQTTSKPTESQVLGSSSTNPSNESHQTTTEFLPESTENLESPKTAKIEASTKPTIVSTKIHATSTKTETVVLSSTQKPPTTLKPTINSSTSSSQQATSTQKIETSTKMATSQSSAKSTKVETTTQSTSTMPSTTLPTTATKSSASPSSSATTTQKTTKKSLTPKMPETTLSEIVKTTEDKSLTLSTSTKSSVFDTSKPSITSTPEHTTTLASDATSTMMQSDTPTSTATVTSTTPRNEKALTTVTKGTSTIFDEPPSPTVLTTTKYSTSTKTTSDEISTSSATPNTVTEPKPQGPTTSSKSESTTGHFQTDPPTPAASTTHKNYLTTTSDETPSSTTLQLPPSTTKDVKILGTTTLQNDKITTTTSKADKLPSTTVIQGTTTTPGMEAISSIKAQTSVGTSSSTTVSATKTSTDILKVEISTSSTTVPESSSVSSTDKTIITTTMPEATVDDNKVSSPASSIISTTTTKMPSTTMPELETTKSIASTSESKTSKSSDSETTSSEMTSTSTTTVPSHAGNDNAAPSSLPVTTSTLEGSSSSTRTSTATVSQTTSEKPSTTTVPPTTIEDKGSPTFGDQTSTESMKSTTSKIASNTVEDKTTSLKTASDKVTVPPKSSTSSSTSVSESEKSTSKSSYEETMASRTDSVPGSSTTTADSGSSSTTTSTSKSSKKATKSATQSTVQSAESTNSSPKAPSDPSSTPPPKTRKTTTKRPTSTSTQSPICNSTCPPGFTEAENACFKFIHSNSTEGTYFDDFLNACTSMKGVIASLSDYANLKNVRTFQAMTNSQNPKPAMVFVNAVPSKYFRRTQIVPVIELGNYSYANFQVIGLSATEKYPNVSVICRVGKHCQAYTCPVMEYFIPPTAKYLAADVQINTVLKANEKLSVQCTATPIRNFEVKCDERGFLLPDSSFITCDAKNEIKSEPNGPVKSCAECDKLQTASCQPLPSGEFYCNCKELYDGKTCMYPFNACENVTCENGGTCINRYTYAFCQCEPEYFGSVCQYEFYGSYEAWGMRAMAYTVTAVAAAEHAVRTKKQLTPSAPGRFGTLPTETAKFYSSIFGALALMFRIMFEFPDSEGLADQIQCGTTFVITMSLAFCSLTAMAAESVIALGVVINATTNCFDGHYRNRKNCVDNWRFTMFYATFSIIPFIIFCAFSSEMVTPHSCIGVLPFPDFPDGQQYAGLGLVALMSIYTLVPFGLALIAKHYLDHNIFATRRRYDADLVDPTAYGREILPIELNVRYYLLALKPVFFTIAWFSFITAAEKMAWWATWLATICSGIYGIISFLQNQLTVYENLDATIVRAMNWLPKKYAPNYNYITLRTRNDYLKVRNPEKYQKEQEEKLNGGPAVQFPIPFDQNLERLMRTDKPGVLNRSAFFKLVPTGLHKIIIKKWKLQYLRLRAAGHSQGGAIRLIWWDIQNEKLATPLIPFTTIIPMFVNFWDNCRHWDRLNDLDTRSKKVLQRGVEMLEIKPLMKIEVAKVMNSRKSRNVKFFRDDPLMNFDQQQIVYDRLQQICKSFTPEDLEKDEIETIAYVRKYFYYCYKRRSHLTKRVLDNRRRTVHDFVLDERRPNFIGPRTYENQIPPGISYLEHTAYYWEFLNYETWKRLRIQAKYISLNVELRYEYNLWDEIFPWNWEKHSRDPNLIFDPSKYRALDLPNILEENEDLEDESEDNSEAEN